MRKALPAGAVLGVAVAIGAESGPLHVGTEAQAERASANGVQIAIDRRAGTTVRGDRRPDGSCGADAWSP